MPRPTSHKALSMTVTATLALSMLAAVHPASVLAKPAIELHPDAGPPGAGVIVTGGDYPASTEVRIHWIDVTGPVIAESTTNASGSFRASFKIPNVSPGSYLVFACAAGSTICPSRAQAILTVQPPPTPTPTPTPTPKPTPTPTPTPKPTPTPRITARPATPAPITPPPATPTPAPSSLTAEPTPTPGPTLPIPSFPLTGPTPTATPLDLIAVTPPPTPPSGVAASVGPFPDLDVLAIEVTQGIQDLNNNMPLVAGRRTYARVYLDVLGANELAHTYGALEARRGGQQIGWMWPENGPITATANGGNRLDLDDSLYFRLPNAWLDGTVTLTAFVYSHDVEFPWTKEPTAENNFESETVTFHEAEPLDIHLVTLHLHRSFHPTDVVRDYIPQVGGALDLATSNANETARILAGLRRYHPISELVFDVFPVPIEPLEHGSDDEWDLGDCSTTVIDGTGTVVLADWQPLMKDDTETEVVVDQYTIPDRDTIWVMDREIDVTHFYPREDGSASVFGSMTGSGPAPFPGAPAFVDGCPNPNDESGEPNSTVALHRVWYDWAETREFFVGLVDESLRTRWGGLASSLDTAWVKMRTAVNPDWYLSGAATMAHEVGHLAGLQHVPCENNNNDDVPDELAGGPIDESHPQMDRFPDCSLAEIREHGYYGFDVYHDLFGLAEPVVISNNPAAPSDNVAYPLLSYESPRWADPYHWCLLLAYYGVPCDADGLDEPFDPPTNTDSFWFPGGHGDPPDPGLPLLLVSGSIDHDASSANLRGKVTIEDPTTAILEQLERQPFVPDDEIVARLVVLDAAGTTLFEAPIADRSSVHEATATFAFDLLVPLDPDAARVEVVDPAGQTVETLEIVHSGLEARWTEPVGETGSVNIGTLAGACCRVAVPALDAGVITSTLLYSPDGEHWQVVGAATGTQVTLDQAVIGTLPGSDAGTLRMLVTDGVSTTIAADEPTVQVPNRPPTVWVESPSVPIAYPVGGKVVLAGAAHDREDRDVPDDGLAWSSSIDGLLGSGPEVTTRTLSPGRHRITLEATDSAGASALASIELLVDGSVVATGPSPELEATVAGILDRKAAGTDPAPVAAVAAAEESGVTLPLIIVVGLIVFAVGATSVWIRVAQPHVNVGRDFEVWQTHLGGSAQAQGQSQTATSANEADLTTESGVTETPPDEGSTGS